jgi:uncharacterized protein (TIGR02646 family)
MSSLGKLEQDFGQNVLKSPQARAFYRSWRKRSANESDAWSAIRKDSFTVSGKEHLGVTIIKPLRKHLVALQGERCCYCRRRLDGIAYARQIEHILPKSVYKQYTFSYRNLAVACFNCNHIKSKDNWSTWPENLRRYIPEKSCGGFFHARLHDYDTHVRYLHLETNGASISVYLGLTPQGRQLCTDLLKKSAGRTLSTSANPRFAAAMDKLRVQVEQMTHTHDDSRLMDFMEALELAADPV